MWPHGKSFAFTIFDDTDNATKANVAPVYDALDRLGFRTTKSVWVFGCDSSVRHSGASLEDRDYLEWIRQLHSRGFEIALHNVSCSTSDRARVIEGLDRFESLFGRPPRIHCNHSQCLENLYWGEARLSGPRRLAYRVLTRGRNSTRFRGHVEGDPLFWGDIARDRITYVRNFVFREINTLKACPSMPYHDPWKPYVPFWFASTDTPDLQAFLDVVTSEAIDRLARESGLCILYAHFASGFVSNGVVNSDFLRRMEQIRSRGGWFAPVGDVLDYLRGDSSVGARSISDDALASLEWKWLGDKISARLGR